MKLSKNTIERSLWTGAEALVALALTVLPGISAWWAAPIALVLAGLKTHVLDSLAHKSSG